MMPAVFTRLLCTALYVRSIGRKKGEKGVIFVAEPIVFYKGSSCVMLSSFVI
jgi:hypothetical protein